MNFLKNPVRKMTVSEMPQKFSSEENDLPWILPVSLTREELENIVAIFNQSGSNLDIGEMRRILEAGGILVS